jgi:hypothetical protein
MAFDANILLRGAAMNQQKQSDLFNRLYGMQRDKQQDALRQQQIQAQQASAQQAQANADRNFELQEKLAEFQMNKPAEFEQQVQRRGNETMFQAKEAQRMKPWLSSNLP